MKKPPLQPDTWEDNFEDIWEDNILSAPDYRRRILKSFINDVVRGEKIRLIQELRKWWWNVPPFSDETLEDKLNDIEKREELMKESPLKNSCVQCDEELTAEIIRLSDLWYQYVSFNHHKDRDCHWYIETDFAYGDRPTFNIFHNGYIYYKSSPIKAETYHQALVSLLNMIKNAFKDQKAWCEEVLADAYEWDKEQIKQAEYYQEHLLPEIR